MKVEIEINEDGAILYQGFVITVNIVGPHGEAEPLEVHHPNDYTFNDDCKDLRDAFEYIREYNRCSI